MIFGGVPYYWNLLRPDMSLAQNIDTLFFSGHGALRDEFGFLYASIFRNAGEHIAIVEALSKKKVGMTREEIASAAGQKMGGRGGSYARWIVPGDLRPSIWRWLKAANNLCYEWGITNLLHVQEYDFNVCEAR